MCGGAQACHVVKHSPRSRLLERLTDSAVGPAGVAALLALIYLCTTSHPLFADDAAPSHYDLDADGLIEVATPEQLNAIRYDLNGDGAAQDDESTEDVDEAVEYAAAFPVTSEGNVCPAGTSCGGYEMTADLDLDTDGDGTAGDGDAFWNNGAGWQPIGALDAGFTATFEGNGRTISNLFIDRSTTTNAGLFGVVDEGGQIRNVALVDLSVTGGGYVGGLVGRLNSATVSGSSTTGTVTGSSSRIGGLVGYSQNSIIEDSSSSASVTGTGGGRAGGLVGELQRTGSEGGVKSVVRRSYATGRVSSNQTRVGGLVGNLHQQSTPSALVVSSYATGAVSGSSGVGGLVGRSNGEVRASYATGASSATKVDGLVGGLVGDDKGTVTASYFDTDTSPEQAHETQGKTTAQLQKPTGYETPANNIYAAWNVDLDGDDVNDDPWDFGTSSQYPALKLDGPDEDTAATWQEFGCQLRSRPQVSVTATTTTSVTLTWTAPAATDYPGTPTITYQVYRDGAPIGAAQAGVTYTDSSLAEGSTHDYRVDVLLKCHPADGKVAPPTLSVSVADAEGVEGSNVSFTVTKTGTGAVSLEWTAAIEESDTADQDDDLVAPTSGTVAFNASDTSKSFTVATAQDTEDESDETFTVTLTVSSGTANLIDGVATGTITDDDQSAGAPTGLSAATGGDKGEVDLRWTAPSGKGVLNGIDPATITGYQYRQASSSAGFASATWTDAGTATTLTVTGLTGGTTYYFQVRALNGVTPEGTASNEANAAAKARSSNADLSALVISQGTLSPEFAATETAYTASVANSVTSMTVAPTAADSNATVSVNDAAVSSGSASGAINLTVGDNAIKVVVTAEDGTKKTYTITVTRAGPSVSIADANGPEGGNVSFTVTKTGTGAVTLSWIASIEGSDTGEAADLGTPTSGTVALTESETSKTFSVATAQDAIDDDSETFTVTLAVSSGTANLSNGVATGTITDDDESAGAPTSLSAATGSDDGEVDLTWTAPSDTGVLNGTDPAAITGYEYRQAESSAGLTSAAWAGAETTTTFTVTGLNGGTTYYFQVRALNGVTPEGAASSEASATARTGSSNANLSALAVSNGTLSPVFTGAETTYTASVANSVTSMTVTPTAADSDATISVNDTAVTSGSPSGTITINVGSNTIEVVVTVEDGTEKTYTITVNRAGPAISIAGTAGAEGDSLSFTVSKTGVGAVTFGWTASIGDSDTAEAADLGATKSGSVSFAASDNRKTLSVATAEDAMDEGDETFTVTLTARSGTPNVTDGTAEGTITDDDESAGAPTSLTASTGSAEGEVDLSWTAPSKKGILNGMDIAAITGYQYRQAESRQGLASATWDDAETATTFTVTSLTGGTTYFFQVRALNGVTPEGAASSEASATAKALSSNANLSGLSISPGALTPDFTAAGTAYTAAVANDAGALTVTPTAADGNATIAVNDAAVTSGSASGTIALKVGSNDLDIVVTAENGTKKTYTITVNRAGPSVSIADADGTEGGNVSFTVTKTGTGAVTLDWTVSVKDSDTATTADLGATTSGTAAFTESETGKTFSVATAQDAIAEGNETFTITLAVASGIANITDGTATGTIADDDESAAAPTSLTAAAGTNWGEIGLSWKAPSDTGVLNGRDPAAITGYQYRGAESSAGLEPATWTDAGTATTFTVTGLTGGVTYFFQVRALNGVTPEGGVSREASAKAKALSCKANLSGLAVSRVTALSDHDSDGDGLIEVTTVEQLNAVRYDLDGDGAVVDDADTADVDEAALYAAAFPVTPGGSVCPEGAECTGYELMADLDLDTDGDGTADAGDAYWNGEAGWLPIGALNAGYAAIFEGNGRTISNLFIDRSAATNVGLFGVVAEGSEIRNLALAGLCVTGEQYVGGLVGRIEGAIVSGASAAGAVAGSRGRIGGLIGYGQNSIIEDSWSSADVTAMGTGSRRAVGGLVGELQVLGQADGVKSVVRRSYATGRVTSNMKRVGGLVGNLFWEGTPSALVIASYATGAVSGGSDVGGLVGRSNGEVRASYATGAVYGDSNVGGLIGNDQQRPATLSYFDTDTSGHTDATQGKTTAELQTPTGYDDPAAGNIYAEWNVDLDGDNINDDPWDFGTSCQYPVLKADGLDDDTTATWQEFGSQLRSRLTVSVNAGITAAALRWTAPATADYPGMPTVMYQVYRDEAPIGPAQNGLTYLDTGLAAGFKHVYRVDVLLNGEPARSSNTVEARASTTALSSNADLSGLAVSQGPLSPDFDAGETAYTAAVANSVASLTVTPTADDSNATIKVNGTAVESGSPSKPFALRIGANITRVIVTAEDVTEKTYTITVMRAGPSISVTNASGIEGGDVTFAVSKTGTGSVSLNWNASIGESDTATSSDLGDTTSGTVAFTESETSKTFSVATDQDAMAEGYETFTVTLTVQLGPANITNDTATGTITDDDEPPGPPTSLTAAAGTNWGEIDLSWTAPSNSGVINGTDPAAITGYQYRSAHTSAGLDTAAWNNAGTATNYTVTGLIGGTTYYFQVRALNGVTPQGAASIEASAAAKALPVIFIGDAAGAEGSSLSFIVSKAGSGEVTLGWRASIERSDTAAVADLGAAKSGTVSFAAWDTSSTVSVATDEDAIDEDDETFTVTIITIASDTAILTDNRATGTITDDDESPGAPGNLMASTGSGEGEVDLSWTAPSHTGVLNGAVPAIITGYQYRHAESGAGLASTAWTDAGMGTNFTVSGLKGGATYYFQVRALNGVTPEGTASNEANAIAKALPSISIADAAGAEGSDLSFVVSKTGPGAVTIDWRASFDESDTASTVDLGGTASGTLTFTHSENSKTFIVAAAQDAIEEGNETFTVAITAAPGIAILIDETATGTITDDDESAGAPSDLSAETGGGEGEIDLSWTAPSDAGVLNGTDPATITGYQYRHAKFSFGLASAAWTDAGQETNLTVASLEGGTLYYLEVRALNGVTPEGAPSPAVIGISGAFDSGSTSVTGQDSGHDVNVDASDDTTAPDDQLNTSTGPDEEPLQTPTPVPSSTPPVTPTPIQSATPVPVPTPALLSTPVLMPTPAPASNVAATPHPTATETPVPSPAPTPGIKPPQGLAPATGPATTDAFTAMQVPRGEGSRGMPLLAWLLIGLAVSATAAAGAYAFHRNGRGSDDSPV